MLCRAHNRTMKLITIPKITSFPAGRSTFHSEQEIIIQGGGGGGGALHFYIFILFIHLFIHAFIHRVKRLIGQSPSGKDWDRGRSGRRVPRGAAASRE